MTDDLDVDDLVSPTAAATFGEGTLPTAAVLIVETISETGPGIRYCLSAGYPLTHAIGALRSVTRALEAADLTGWQDDQE